MALKTIYFDLGNVLCFYSKAKMIGQLAACSGVEPLKIQRLFREQGIQARYERGEISTQELYQIFLKHCLSDLSYPLFMKAITNIFHPNKALWSCIKKLKEKGIRLILLSNTCESHHGWISENYPILTLFDHQVLSFELGLRKPDPLIFKKALEFANCEAHECFYVDDLQEHIENARVEGIHSERFSSIETFTNQLKNKFNLSI